jgi:hypothetical protein
MSLGRAVNEPVPDLGVLLMGTAQQYKGLTAVQPRVQRLVAGGGGIDPNASAGIQHSDTEHIGLHGWQADVEKRFFQSRTVGGIDELRGRLAVVALISPAGMQCLPTLHALQKHWWRNRLIPVLNQLGLRQWRGFVAEAPEISGVEVLRLPHGRWCPEVVATGWTGVAAFCHMGTWIKIQKRQETPQILGKRFLPARKHQIRQRIGQLIQPVADRLDVGNTCGNPGKRFTTGGQRRCFVQQKLLGRGVMRKISLSALIEATVEEIVVTTAQSSQGVAHHHHRNVVMAKTTRVERSMIDLHAISKADEAPIVNTIEAGCLRHGLQQSSQTRAPSLGEMNKKKTSHQGNSTIRPAALMTGT